MKQTVWNSDACEMYDSVCSNMADFFPELDESELDAVSDEEKWSVAHDEVERWLDDEVTNLDIDVKGKIVLVGTLERWNGSFPAFNVFSTKNIGEAIKKAMESFSGDNTFEVYVEGESMYLSQRGHDNPTNPSVVEFRELIGDLEEFDTTDITPEGLKKHSKSLAPYVCKVYGWAREEAV